MIRMIGIMFIDSLPLMMFQLSAAEKHRRLLQEVPLYFFYPEIDMLLVDMLLLGLILIPEFVLLIVLSELVLLLYR